MNHPTLGERCRTPFAAERPIRSGGQGSVNVTLTNMLRKLCHLILFFVLAGMAQGQALPRWERARTAAGEKVRLLLSADPLHQTLPAYVNSNFNLPRQLPIVYTESGSINAWYSHNQHQITVSYDLGVFLLKFFRAKGEPNPELRTRQTIAFILLHELGHALIHELDLPAVGREEDAADELATILAVQALDDRGVELALTAAHWFNLMGSEQIELSKLPFWDEHGLDKQRYFKILCLLYGSTPTRTESIISPLVPYTRLRSAQERYPKKLQHWDRLLAAHRKPPGTIKPHAVYPDAHYPRNLTFQSDAPAGQLQPVGELLRVRGFQSLIQMLNNRFLLPKDLVVNYRATDLDMNMFLPLSGHLVLSRNFFDTAYKKLARRYKGAELEQSMRALESFSLLLELSRALIEDCDLPITGEPEAAASELAIMIVVANPELRPMALSVSHWYETLAAENSNVLQVKYWSESALDKQAYFDLLGYLYSADPVTYAPLGQKFDKRRRQKLAWEYKQKLRNWRRLLQPFGDPF